MGEGLGVSMQVMRKGLGVSRLDMQVIPITCMPATSPRAINKDMKLLGH